MRRHTCAAWLLATLLVLLAALTACESADDEAGPTSSTSASVVAPTTTPSSAVAPSSVEPTASGASDAPSYALPANDRPSGEDPVLLTGISSDPATGRWLLTFNRVQLQDCPDCTNNEKKVVDDNPRTRTVALADDAKVTSAWQPCFTFGAGNDDASAVFSCSPDTLQQAVGTEVAYDRVVYLSYDADGQIAAVHDLWHP